MIDRVQNLRRALGMLEPLGSLPLELERLRLQLGRAEAARVAALPADAPLADAEFQVFSQFGEDGIIQHLVNKVPIENDVFVEFGVEDYTESNTRFLLVNDNWRGLVIDGVGRAQALPPEPPDRVAPPDRGRDRVHRPRQHQPAHRRRRDRGDIGILSIDLDGNDLWVLEAIDVVSPRILILEYNATFGPEAAVTVPYDPSFVRGEKHCVEPLLGRIAGGAHAHRAREGVLAGRLEPRGEQRVLRARRRGRRAARASTPPTRWRPSRFRESRGPDGELTYVSDRMERLRLMRDMPVHDLDPGGTVTIGERFGV